MTPHIINETLIHLINYNNILYPIFAFICVIIHTFKEVNLETSLKLIYYFVQCLFPLIPYLGRLLLEKYMMISVRKEEAVNLVMRLKRILYL